MSFLYSVRGFAFRSAWAVLLFWSSCAWGQQYCPPTYSPTPDQPFYCPPNWIPGQSLPGQPAYGQSGPAFSNGTGSNGSGVNSQPPGQSFGGSPSAPQYSAGANSGQSSGQPNSAGAPNASTAQTPGGTNSGVQNALAQMNDQSDNSVAQAAFEEQSGADSFGGGYGDLAQAPPNTIGDFFGSRLSSRRALIGLNQNFLFLDSQVEAGLGGLSGITGSSAVANPLLGTGGLVPFTPNVFVQVNIDDLNDPFLVTNSTGELDFAFQRNSDGSVRDIVQFTRTDQAIDVPVTGGFETESVPVTVIQADSISSDGIQDVGDSGSFVLRTVEALPGLHPSEPIFDPAVTSAVTPGVRFTEDINRNGVLDPGEDLNNDGVISFLVADQTEVFGLYRDLVVPSPGEFVGRLKVAENNNPVPRDRLIFDYTFFADTGVTTEGRDVSRFVPGFEKTFFGGNASIDVRLPFATTVESDITTATVLERNGFSNASGTELGNVSVTGKLLLANDENGALSVGLQTVFPTANDVVVATPSGQELIRVRNEAIRTMPFIAWQLTPSDRSFFQYYLQYDTTSGSNPLEVFGAPVGSIDDVDFIYADFSMGYWLYRNFPRTRTYRTGRHVHTAIEGSRGITGFAPRFELHYNRSLSDVSARDLGGVILGESSDKLESLNVNLGATMYMGASTELTVAWGTPLLNRDESDFNHEVRVMFNWIMPK